MPPNKTYLVRGKGGKRKTEKSSKLYTLVVYLVGGPAEDIEDPIISRTIQIRGDQTLKHLHRAIFKAFNRSDEHLYEFDLGEDGPDSASKIYSIPMDSVFPGLDDRELAGDVSTTTMDSLGLELDRRFSYTFDYTLTKNDHRTLGPEGRCQASIHIISEDPGRNLDKSPSAWIISKLSGLLYSII
jgi:hypothetical protein